MKQYHPKIKALQLRATPVMSSSYVNEAGQLVDFKIETPEERTIEGYLAVWGVRDDYGTIFTKGAFAKSIQERGPKSAAKYKIVMLWQHQQDEPIGQFTELVEDDYGLRFKAVLDDVPTAERALRQIRSGTINQFSIGFDYDWDKLVYNDQLDAILVNEAVLWEGSAVTMASNVETFAIRSVADLEKETLSLHEWTEDFIKSLPRKQHLEIRQLITRHISLAKAQPKEGPSLEQREKPVEEVNDFYQKLFNYYQSTVKK